MEFILKHKDKMILAAILCLAAFLIFFRLGRADMLTDDSLYAFRSLGWLDFLDSQFQPTPVQWFDQIPAWSRLSFHDAPPLAFIIQYLFFKVFGESVLVSRLPFAIAGFGAVLLLYLLVKKLYNKNTALLAALIMSVLNFQLWASRTGYLEAVMVFFVLLTLYFFLKGFENNNYFLIFGIFLGLTFLTKYTSFFLIPFIILYILFKDKKIFFNKKFLLGILIASILFSPIIYYNFKFYQARGHFDLQFSQFFNQTKAFEDWPKFKHDGEKNYLANFFGSILALRGLMFFSTFVLFIISLLFLAYNFLKDLFFIPLSFLSRIARRGKLQQKSRNLKDIYLFLFFYLFSLLLVFAFIGGSERLLPPLTPLIAAVMAVFLISLNGFLVHLPIIPKKITFNLFWFLVTSLILLEVLYAINTNLLYKPIGQAGKFYAISRFDNLGYNQLEDYILKEVSQKPYFLTAPKKVESFADVHSTFQDLSNKDLFVFDPNLRWFAVLWYFRRMAVYHNLPIASGPDLAFIVPKDANWFQFFQSQGVKNLYFIKGADESVLGEAEKNENNLKEAERFAGLFVLNGARVIEIKNPHDEVTFRVYKLKLN